MNEDKLKRAIARALDEALIAFTQGGQQQYVVHPLYAKGGGVFGLTDFLVRTVKRVIEDNS